MFAHILSQESVIALLDFRSPLWSRLLGRGLSLLALPAVRRQKLFEDLLNVTATPDRWLPEISFDTTAENQLTAAAASASASGSGGSSDAAPSALSGAPGVFAQMCAALRATPDLQLRNRTGEVTWKATLKGVANRGAQGLPGPFRQSLSELASDLRKTSPNTVSDHFLHITVFFSVSLTRIYFCWLWGIAKQTAVDSVSKYGQ
jgi:hypothetical protein